MERRVIINADDFGLCEGVNRAVEKSHLHGVLTSASVMTNMPFAEEAVQIAKKHPKLGVGVHLNLTKGRPLSNEASLAPLLSWRGRFVRCASVISFLTFVIPTLRKALKAEFAAQIKWLIDKGIRPSHLDSHKNFHTFAYIYPIVCQVAREFNIPAIRYCYEPREVSILPWPVAAKESKKKARLVSFSAKINRLQNPGFLKTEGTFGMSHIGRINENYYRALSLYNSLRTAELMTHPGFPEGLNREKTGLIYQRKAELDALCSERTKKFLADAGMKLINYSRI